MGIPFITLNIDSLHHQCMMTAVCAIDKVTAAIHYGYESTFQTCSFYHLQGQVQQTHGNTPTCKFPSKPHTILT